MARQHKVDVFDYESSVSPLNPWCDTRIEGAFYLTMMKHLFGLGRVQASKLSQLIYLNVSNACSLVLHDLAEYSLENLPV